MSGANNAGKRSYTEGPMPEIDLENLFTYHSPKGDQPRRYEELLEAAKQLAQVIVNNCPDCADRTFAIRQVRMACMTANGAIACNE